MAYVLIFAPQDFVNIPKHGTIQFHPSPLPLHRGPSSINWPIMIGRKTTGLTIFRPNDGLDEGAIVLQKEVPIGPDDTLGSVYFDKIFPAGVAALLEAADLVLAGKAKETIQDEAKATYEGWVREAESRLNWANHVDTTYNIIRGCNPAPGAWTTINGEKLQIFDAKKTIAPTFGAVRGKKIGQVVEIGASSFTVHGAGGFIEVLRCKRGEGKKISGTEARINTRMNIYFSALDAIALYGLLGLRKPSRYLEVGSGNSTMFARRAIRDLGLGTQITSIDPQPRAEIDALCDRVVRTRLEEFDLALFD